MFISKTAKLAASLIIAALPFTANAASGLTIDNQTDFDSTSVLNNGACSTILGAEGVTNAHTKKTVSASKIRLACLGNWSNCKAVVYMSNNCTGPVAATVYFDINTGIKSVQSQSDKFEISGSGFTSTLKQK